MLVKIGEMVTVYLVLLFDTFMIVDNADQMTWEGEMANVSFTGSCLETVTSGAKECLLYVHYWSGQKQVAQLRFCLQVWAKEEDDEPSKPQKDSGAVSRASTPVHQIEAQRCA